MKRRGWRFNMKDHDLCDQCWRSERESEHQQMVGGKLQEWGLSRNGEWHRVVANHMAYMDTACGLDYLQLVRAEKFDPATRRFHLLHKCEKCDEGR